VVCPNAEAQGISATISGIVRDSSSAVLPGATVTVRNIETGIARTLTTDEGGRYVAPALPPGTYEVRGELTGFAPSVRTGIVLSVGREAVVDFILQVGAMSDELTSRVTHRSSTSRAPPSPGWPKAAPSGRCR
jgi:hypothetical protein